MKYIVLLTALFLSTTLVRAHQPDISTLMIVQKDDGSWILQMRASLTAFQQEVRKHYAETPYKTPEEFQEMVLDHLRKNLDIQTAQGQHIDLTDGNVKLGHETSVFFDLNGLPKDFKELNVKNTSFSDIYKSRIAFILLKQNFEKKQVMLDKKNNFATTLITHGNHFEEFISEVEEEQSTSKYLLVIVLGGTAIFLLIFTIYRYVVKHKKTTLAI